MENENIENINENFKILNFSYLCYLFEIIKRDPVMCSKCEITFL